MSGLDPLGRAEFSEWILELRQRNKAILLCMHELEMIDQLCDEVVMLARGRLVYSSHDEGVENRVMWLLSASGISRDSLDALTSHLPASFSRETVDLAHKFWFKDQQVALKWLKTLSTEGVLIQEFKEDHSLYLNKLLALYKGIAK
jgi:ABC-type multidrug transport system ATPase subunit